MIDKYQYQRDHLVGQSTTSRPIYVNVDSPNLGFPYSNFLGGASEKKNTLYIDIQCILYTHFLNFEHFCQYTQIFFLIDNDIVNDWLVFIADADI